MFMTLYAKIVFLYNDGWTVGFFRLPSEVGRNEYLITQAKQKDLIFE